MMQITLLVVVALALLQNVAQGADQTIRLEFDPDVDSVTGPCTDGFMSALTDQISAWFADGVASYKNVAVDHPQLTFKNTVKRGGGVRRDVSEESPLPSVHQEERGLCSYTTCVNCCPKFCSSWCTNGSCGKLCGSSRNLRRADEETRMTVVKTDTWWSGDETMQVGVAKAMQNAAQQWLSANDATQCMGNPKKLKLQLNYF